MAEAGAETIAVAVEALRRRLGSASDTPALDARLLAAHAFGLDAGGLILKGAQIPDADRAEDFRRYGERRLAGEPVHRIIGRRAFYDHEFELSPQTLEPRPDTEVLVELAAKAIRKCGLEAPRFADLGTGTGAIAVSLLALFPRANCVAVDLSPQALETARRNAERAGVVSRFEAVVGDYLAPVTGPLALVVSNPPYIPADEIEALAAEVRLHDPRLALDGGVDGLDAYRAIARQLAERADGPADVLFEIGAGQASDVAAIMGTVGYELLERSSDLGGHIRALWFRRLSL